MIERVELWAIGDTGEALLIRALLESLGVEVRLLPLGSPRAVLDAAASSTGEPTILSAHGSARGFYLGEFGPEVDTGMLDGPWLPAAAIAGLRGPVISTACESAGFAGHWPEARPYIAPRGEPEGADIPLYLHHLFHRVRRHGLGWQDAHSAAVRAVPEAEMTLV